MSLPIQPTHGPTATGPPLSAGGATRATLSSPPAPAAQPPVSLETFPSSPPQEVLDEMDGAARIHDSLRAMGRELRFAHDEQSGRMTIQVRDHGGRVLRTISPSEALDIAAGKPLQ